MSQFTAIQRQTLTVILVAVIIAASVAVTLAVMGTPSAT